MEFNSTTISAMLSLQHIKLKDVTGMTAATHKAFGDFACGWPPRA